MRLPTLRPIVSVFVLLIAVSSAPAVDCGDGCRDSCECYKCECVHCGHKMIKCYRPVVTFKCVCFNKYDYCTKCCDVLAPTSTCAPCCKCKCDCGCSDGCDGSDLCGSHSGPCQPKGLGSKICGFFGSPKTIKVPVAVEQKCSTCKRLVPCVTWVVEYKCVKCCKEDH